MKLTNYEKETIFLFNEADRTASIHTHNAALIRQLTRLCISCPEEVRRIEDKGGYAWQESYSLYRSWQTGPPMALRRTRAAGNVIWTAHHGSINTALKTNC